MVGHEDQPYGFNERSNQEAGLRCLVLVLFAIASLVFGLTRLEISPLAWITNFLDQLEIREIKIISHMSLTDDKGTWTASGPAVSEGLLCNEGDVKTLAFQNLSPDPNVLSDLLVRQRFVCRDWSGYFIIDLDVDLFEGGTSGTWQVVDGVRDYENLVGIGTFEGINQPGNVILDTFFGEVWINE